MSEVAPAGGGPNRTFIVLALGLVGLLIIATVVLVGIIFIPRLLGTTAPSTPSRTVSISFATTPTRAALVVFTPTAAASESPTATLVNPLVSGATTPVSGGALTPTTSVTPGTGTPGTGMPPTGVGEDLLLLAGGIVLVFVIIAARRARSTVAA